MNLLTLKLSGLSQPNGLKCKWKSHGNVVRLCAVASYLGRNNIPYRCNNLSNICLEHIRVYDLDIYFKSNKQYLAFKKRFG